MEIQLQSVRVNETKRVKIEFRLKLFTGKVTLIHEV